MLLGLSFFSVSHSLFFWTYQYSTWTIGFIYEYSTWIIFFIYEYFTWIIFLIFNLLVFAVSLAFESSRKPKPPIICKADEHRSPAPSRNEHEIKGIKYETSLKSRVSVTAVTGRPTAGTGTIPDDKNKKSGQEQISLANSSSSKQAAVKHETTLQPTSLAKSDIHTTAAVEASKENESSRPKPGFGHEESIESIENGCCTKLPSCFVQKSNLQSPSPSTKRKTAPPPKPPKPAIEDIKKAHKRLSGVEEQQTLLDYKEGLGVESEKAIVVDEVPKSLEPSGKIVVKNAPTSIPDSKVKDKLILQDSTSKVGLKQKQKVADVKPNLPETLKKDECEIGKLEMPTAKNTKKVSEKGDSEDKKKLLKKDDHKELPKDSNLLKELKSVFSRGKTKQNDDKKDVIEGKNKSTDEENKLIEGNNELTKEKNKACSSSSLHKNISAVDNDQKQPGDVLQNRELSQKDISMGPKSSSDLGEISSEKPGLHSIDVIKTGSFPPVRPPPPSRKCFKADDNWSVKSEQIRPERPPPPTPPVSLRKLRGLTRKNRSRSKTVELSPESLKSPSKSSNFLQRFKSLLDFSKTKSDKTCASSEPDLSITEQAPKEFKSDVSFSSVSPEKDCTKGTGSKCPDQSLAECSERDKVFSSTQRPSDKVLSDDLGSTTNSQSSSINQSDIKVPAQTIALTDENTKPQPSIRSLPLSAERHDVTVGKEKENDKDISPTTQQLSPGTSHCDDVNSSKTPGFLDMTSNVISSRKVGGAESDMVCGKEGTDPSAGISKKDSVRSVNPASKKEGRSSIFYRNIQSEATNDSVQMSPDSSACQVSNKDEDSGEPLGKTKEFRQELNSILQRQLGMKSAESEVKVPVRGVSSETASTKSSDVSCQESSEESEVDQDVPSEILTPEEKMLRKLKCIANEIMTSESTFVDVLRLLNNDFRSAVRESSEEKGSQIVPDEVMNTIFRYLPQLQNLNENLLHEIKERTDNWGPSQKISDVIVKIGPFLKLYSSYIREFESVSLTLDEACRKHPQFGQLVKDFEARSVCQKLALKHFLLKPVQRIPQYRLLLEDYLRNLTPDSADYDDTVKALQIVSEVANHANEYMKQGDNCLKLVSIQNSLLTHHVIVKPGKVFIREGELMKLSRRVMQSRWFILFNDSLLYLTPVQQGLFRINHELPLTGMKVSVSKVTEYGNEFSVISVTRSFTLAAKSPEERDGWMRDLTGAIKENNEKRSSFFSKLDKDNSFHVLDVSLGEQAPIWIPDSRVTMCQICTTEFTVTYRRHHCRACGRVVCGNCSLNKAVLKYLDNQSARVCDVCRDKLGEGVERNSRALSTASSGGQMSPDLEVETVKSGAPGSRISKIGGKKANVLLETSKEEGKVSPTLYSRVRANDQGSDISGHLHMLNRKAWKRFWFVVKDKVLYTYKASEDVAAIKSLPLLGYTVESATVAHQGVDPEQIFILKHSGQPDMVFYAESVGVAERWVKAVQSATVL